VPREKKIFTFPIDRATFALRSKPVAVMPWTDLELGPYELLHFHSVPENIMPASPAAQINALAKLVNNIMGKQAKRAESQKRVHAYSPAGAKDAANIQRASDDEFREVTAPDEIKTYELGGVNPENQAFLIGCLGMFDRMAGNLTNRLGLGSQAPTLGQEQMIGGQVSRQEASMQARVVEFSCRVLKDLGWLLWEDVVQVLPGRMALKGAPGHSVDATWRPGDREGAFPDYDISIDMFSMPYQSPAQRIQGVNALITQIYAPLAQLLAQQGGQLNLQKLTEIYATHLNLPELREIFQFVEAPSPQERGGETGGAPANTTREYIRRNVPTGGTMESRQHTEQQGWLDRAGQVNQDQAASLGMMGG
jgi:hypothetical protein